MFSKISFYNKYLKFLFRQRIRGFKIPDEPRFYEDAGEEFEKLLAKSKNYLEYGTGGTTVVAARLGAKTLAMETDPYYAKAVKEKIATIKGGDAVDLHYQNIGQVQGFGIPFDLESTPENIELWTQYVRYPFEDIEGEFYDLVLVDAVFRVACALRAIQKSIEMKQDFTLLVDDYSVRDSYHIVEDYVKLDRIHGRTAFFNVSKETILKTPDEEIIKRQIDALN